MDINKQSESSRSLDWARYKSVLAECLNSIDLYSSGEEEVPSFVVAPLFDWSPENILPDFGLPENLESGRHQLTLFRKELYFRMQRYHVFDPYVCRFLYGGDYQSVRQDDDWQIETASAKILSKHERITAVSIQEDTARVFIGRPTFTTQTIDLRRRWVSKDCFMWVPIKIQMFAW